MARKKMTNFGIKSTYIHANQTALAKRGIVKPGNQVGVIGRELVKEAEKDFIKVVGMSPQQFLYSVETSTDVLTKSMEVYNSKSIQDIVKLINEFKTGASDLNGSKADYQKAMKALNSSVSQINGLTELVYQMRFGLGEKSLGSDSFNKFKKSNEDIIKYLSSFNSYQIVEQGLDALDKGHNTMAANLVLFELLKEGVGNAQSAVDYSKGLITHTTEIKFTVVDKLQEALDEFVKAMNSQKVSAIDKAYSKLQGLVSEVNKQVKGTLAEVREGVASLVDVPSILKIVESTMQDTILELSEVSLVGSRSKGSLDIRGSTLSDVGFQILKSLEDQFEYNISTKDMTQDIALSVNYKTANGEIEKRDWGISVKSYNNELVKRGVSLGSNLAIGRAFALARTEKLTQEYLGNTDRSYALFNALVSVMSISDYVPVSDGNGGKKLAPVSRKRTSRGKDTIKIFGNILEELTVLMMYGLFNVPSTQFITINGQIIPTPLYLQIAVDKMQSDVGSPSTYVSYNLAAGAKIINELSTGEKTVANKAKNLKGGFVNYAAPALMRSSGLKKAMIESKLVKWVKPPYLARTDFHKKYNIKPYGGK